MHGENLNGERKVVRKCNGEEFGEVILRIKRAKIIIDQPSMNESL